MMNVCPLVADKLRSAGVMSTVAVRKLFNSIGIQFCAENCKSYGHNTAIFVERECFCLNICDVYSDKYRYKQVCVDPRIST